MPHITTQPTYRSVSTLCIAGLLSTVCGCAILPAQLPHNEVEQQCHMATHRWDLRVEVMKDIHCDQSQCLSLIVAAPLVTGIMSGVFIGIANSVHWLETVNSCN